MVFGEGNWNCVLTRRVCCESVLRRFSGTSSSLMSRMIFLTKVFNGKMFKALLAPLLILALETPKIACLYECCPGPNILFETNASCLTDDSVNSSINLGCSQRFIAPDIDEFFKLGYAILSNGTLTDNYVKITRYCQAKRGDFPEARSPIYIICVEENEENKFDDIMSKAQTILQFISLLFTFLTIIVYFMVPSLLDLQGICIIHTLIGLALGYIFLGVIQLMTDLDDNACKAFAYLIYLSFLYLFFWLVILSFHIWRTTVKPNLSGSLVKWPVLYHIFGMGGPLLGLIIIVLAHYSPSSIWENIRPGFGESSCWFKSSKEIWIYLYGPLIILLILNVVFYLWTIVSLWRQVDNNRKRILRYRLKLCTRLCVIMGITWIFEIITFVMKQHAPTIIGKISIFLLDLFNMVQGILIFLVLVVFRKRVRKALANKNICYIRFPNSWKYLEDEEMDSAEEKANRTIVEFSKDVENGDEPVDNN